MLSDSNHSGEEHFLETDLMRFVAIIGMVFWVTFAFLPKKSIPIDSGTPSESPTITSKQLDKRFTPEQPAVSLQKNEVSIPPPTKRMVPPLQPQTKGIHLQFADQQTLQKHLKDGVVQLFCKANSPGFSLNFLLQPSSGVLAWQKSMSLPSQLWQIKQEREITFLRAELFRAQPELQTMPKHSFFIAFVDTQLESAMEEKLHQLQQGNQSGSLSITSDRQLIFEPANK